MKAQWLSSLVILAPLSAQAEEGGMTEAGRQIFTHNCTASALSFVFENLSKPVIMTGSQIPLSQLRSDARANLLNSLYIPIYTHVTSKCLRTLHLKQYG